MRQTKPLPKRYKSEVYGLPEKEMFPMPDKDGVLAAEKKLKTAKLTAYQKQKVRNAILKKRKEFGMK